jgi:hypothetical protein
MGVTDPTDPNQSREGGARYLLQLLKQYNGSVPMALAAYNEGPGNLQRKGVFPSTQKYVSSIMGPSDALGQMLQAPDPNTDPDFLAARAAQQKSQRVSGQTAQSLQQNQGAIQGVADTLRAINERKYPDVHPLELPKEPQTEAKDPIRALGQFLPLMAILGGSLSRRHSLAALEAATGAMEAQKTGDEKDLQRNHDRWLDEMKRLDEMHQAEKEHFDEAIKVNETDRAAAMAQLSVVAALDNNLLMKDKLAKGDVDGAIQLYQMKSNAWGQARQVWQMSMEQKRAAETERYHNAEIAEKEAALPPEKKAYAHYLEQHPGDEEGAQIEAGRAAMRLHPEKAASITDRLRKQLDTEPVGKAWETTRQFIGSVDAAANDPDIANNPIKQIALIDAFQRIATNQAIRGFTLKAAQDALPLSNQAETLKKKIMGPNGAAIGAKAIKEYIDAARGIAGEMESNYRAAEDKARGAAVMEGGIPEAVGLFGAGDGGGPPNPSKGPQKGALPGDLPSPKGYPDGTKIRDGDKVIAVIKNGQWAAP